ncbi:hypothetical protein PGT21_029481 [Puccinia graminis f. sp. tritici]|uniref:Uncharacterized protein n=1 Tax=Puccinia graminis f. sp. tritici TaxID=56615 RepID=A0A5B0QXK8_PUCGR|nr:hypothetical protein PGT21_029481 [Puccinia graminis f. sp. tritici]KAA1127704.1 hypothetical protein PGTUg99_003166 [Puccinia graminis f. sp. tritici]
MVGDYLDKPKPKTPAPRSILPQRVAESSSDGESGGSSEEEDVAHSHDELSTAPIRIAHDWMI